MSIEIWITYVFAVSLILVVPGPTVVLVISQATNYGRISVVPLITGVVFGDFIAMTFSLTGLGALMSTSAELFTTFKWIAAVYLIYLGIKQFITSPIKSSVSNSSKRKSSLLLFRSSFIVTALNPKGIAFFVVFFPQFITPSEPVLMQLIILGSTFLFLAFLNITIYAIFAGRLQNSIKQGYVRKWFNRLSGSVLIGAGIFTAAMQKSA
jgi:threonine/homoserine/homoserine lactone efflux protein